MSPEDEREKTVARLAELDAALSEMDEAIAASQRRIRRKTLWGLPIYAVAVAVNAFAAVASGNPGFAAATVVVLAMCVADVAILVRKDLLDERHLPAMMAFLRGTQVALWTSLAITLAWILAN